MSLVGQRVVIDGLVAKPEHNGTQGAALSFDPISGRYNVQLDSTGTILALKPQNLQPAAASDDGEAPWYYMGANDKGRQGPLTAAALNALYDAGDGVGDLTPVWSRLMQDWAPFAESPLAHAPRASAVPPPASQGTTAPGAAAAAEAGAATVAGEVAPPDGASVGQAATAAMQALQAQLSAVLDEARGGPGEAKAEAVMEMAGRLLSGADATAALQALLQELEPLMEEAQQQELCDNGGGEHGGSQARRHPSLG